MVDCAADEMNPAHSLPAAYHRRQHSRGGVAYIDGEQVHKLPHSANWVLVDTVVLKSWARVLAVRAGNVITLSHGGLVASDSLGRVRTSAAT